jgi:hypothetical protein
VPCFHSAHHLSIISHRSPVVKAGRFRSSNNAHGLGKRGCGKMAAMIARVVKVSSRSGQPKLLGVGLSRQGMVGNGEGRQLQLSHRQPAHFPRGQRCCCQVAPCSCPRQG